jgi:tetratricopeptide (TPR) repeat protein
MKFAPLLLLLFCANAVLAQPAAYEDPVKRAIALSNAGSDQEAIMLCSQAIAAYPQLPSAYNIRGAALVHLHRNAEALEDFTRAIERCPRFHEAYANRAEVEIELQRYDEAITDCDKAIHISSKSKYAFNNRGCAELKLNRYDEAIKDFDKAVKLDPEFAVATANRARVNRKLGKFSEALLDFNKEVQMSPTKAEAYNDRGVVRVDLHLYEDGISDFNKALELDPGVARFYNNRGYANFRLGYYAKAIADYDQCIQLGGKGYSPYYQFRDEATQALQQRGNPGPPAATNPILNCGWISPMDDTCKLEETDGTELQIRTICSKPLSAANFVILIDGLACKLVDSNLKELPSDQGDFEYTYHMPLKVARGITNVQVVAAVDSFTKSSRVLKIQYSPKDRNLYVISVGIQQTNDPLRYTQKDARDFAALFSDQAGEGKLFRHSDIHILTDTLATTRQIEQHFNELKKQRFAPNDVVVVFISSHAFVDAQGVLRIPGRDYDSRQPEKTSVSVNQEIMAPLDSLGCRKFLFLDACRSGNGADFAIGQLDKRSKKDFIYLMTSSSENEDSYEDDEWQNGAFTLALKEGLGKGLALRKSKGNLIGFDDLGEYVRRRVIALVVKKKKSQTPYHTPNVDINIYSK